MAISQLNRRNFLLSAVATTGALTLGISLTGCSQDSVRPGKNSETQTFNAFISIASDDTVIIQVPCSEMGQGVFTALPMILAEELDADWEKVTAETASADKAYHYRVGWDDQATGGSYAIAGWYAALRQIGAAAREMLTEAAAEKWGVPVAECKTNKAVVSHPASGRSLGYGALVGDASKRPIPENPILKSVDDFQIIGQPKPRKDTAAKVDGSAIFGIDVKLPDMLIATVKTSPTFGGSVKDYNADAALAMPGVRMVVPVPAGVVVIADSFWQAHKAIDALNIIFDPGPHAELSSDKISETLQMGLDEKGLVAHEKGKVHDALKDTNNEILTAVYDTPYLAHACMEPMTCTADVRDDFCHILAPTQFPTNVQRVGAEITGLPLEKVKVDVTFLGGGFGRRFEMDFIEQAILASKAASRPIKLIWSREEDMAHDFYRPISRIRYRAAFDGKTGQALALECRLASPSILARVEKLPMDKVDRVMVEGLSDQPYGFSNARVDFIRKDLGVPVGWWRSVGNSQNGFIRESFIDELAHMRSEDPYQFRRRLLVAEKRHLGVLDLVAEKAGWNDPLAKGHYRGIAVVMSFRSYVAEVAEISVQEDGSVKIHKITCAVDCGTVVNPGIVEAQVISAVIYGLTAAVDGEITIQNGAVEQSNFHDYPALKFGELPDIEVHILKSAEPPTGIGEPGLPPAAPAVANAIFAATGKRIRSLPFSKHGLTIV